MFEHRNNFYNESTQVEREDMVRTVQANLTTLGIYTIQNFNLCMLRPDISLSIAIVLDLLNQANLLNNAGTRALFEQHLHLAHQLRELMLNCIDQQTGLITIDPTTNAALPAPQQLNYVRFAQFVEAVNNINPVHEAAGHGI